LDKAIPEPFEITPDPVGSDVSPRLEAAGREDCLDVPDGRHDMYVTSLTRPKGLLIHIDKLQQWQSDLSLLPWEQTTGFQIVDDPLRQTVDVLPKFTRHRLTT
jgi:hypothetical protein